MVICVAILPTQTIHFITLQINQSLDYELPCGIAAVYQITVFGIISALTLRTVTLLALCFIPYPSFPTGFPHTLTCSLNNTSLVPINFGLRVPGDGSGPSSITSVSQVSDLSRTEWSSSTVPDRPIEFTLTPNSGTVRPQGLVDIQVC